MNSMRTALGRVRHLGSAKEGTHHWLAQRVTALALVPLTIWFVIQIIRHATGDHAAAIDWIGSPFNSLMMVLLIIAVFHHAQLGLQVVIEDYVHNEMTKLAGLLAVKGTCLLLAVYAVISVIRIALGG
ncbi:MAG: succinate dehydrogenase, hydrophobic membrane anchor protein [Rhodospirillales bacterium]